jgi:hypothetical protein
LDDKYDYLVHIRCPLSILSFLYLTTDPDSCPCEDQTTPIFFVFGEDEGEGGGRVGIEAMDAMLMTDTMLVGMRRWFG